MTTLPPLVDISLDAVSEILTGRGFTVCVLGGDHIAGERKVGERTYEELTFSRRSVGDWIGAWGARELADVIDQEGWAVPVYSKKCFLISKAMQSLDDLLNWLQVVDFTERKFA